MEKPEEASEAPAPEPDAAVDPVEPDEAESQDVRQKFRAALERKRGRQAKQRAAGAGKNSPGVHDAHGPAVGRREFRRKSG